MDEKYPGLFRMILTKPGRYNQDLMPASVILEIGADGNRMDEALRAAELVADVVAEVIKRGDFPESKSANG
jgi:stage II sporulation protein P